MATYIPPFREAAWYEGRPSADDYLPFFSCKAVGDVLLDVRSRMVLSITISALTSFHFFRVYFPKKSIERLRYSSAW